MPSPQAKTHLPGMWRPQCYPGLLSLGQTTATQSAADVYVWPLTDAHADRSDFPVLYHIAFSASDFFPAVLDTFGTGPFYFTLL